MGISDVPMHLDKALCTYDGERIIEFEGKHYKKGDVPPHGMQWFKDYLVVKEEWMVSGRVKLVVPEGIEPPTKPL